MKQRGSNRGAQRRPPTPVLTIGLGLLGFALILVALWIVRPDGVSGPSNGPVVINNTAVPPVPTLDPQRVATGETLYAQYCAACHGADLRGAADWKQRLPSGALPPPPHDDSGHTWHHPDDQLLSIVANGGDPAYNGVMPGFANTLTPDQMAAILDYIKSHWRRDSREYQWWMTVVTRGGTP